MDAQYSRATGSLDLCFQPDESLEAATLLQLVWEEEWQKGTLVPDYSLDFFKELAVATKRTPVKFEFEFLEFAIAFLEEAIIQIPSSPADVDILANFLLELRDYCPAKQTVH